MKRLFSYNRDAFSRPLNIIIFVVAVLSLILAVAGPLLMQVNWGFNPVHYLPTALFYIWIILALTVVSLFFFAPREHFISVLTARYLWGEQKLLGRIFVMIAALAIFYFFRFDAHLFGNGYLRVANLAQRTIPVFHWFDYGDTFIPYLLYQLFHSMGVAEVAAAFWAYKVLALASGFVFIAFAFKISEKISKTDDDRLLSLLLFLFSGFVMLFFGLVDNFPLLTAWALVLIFFYIRHGETKELKFLYFIWGGTLIGLFLNFQFVVFIPANLYLSFKHLIKRKAFSSFIGSLAASVFILAAVIILYIKAVGNIALSSHILFLSARLPDVGYWLFSPRHLLDVSNLLLMTIPAFAVIAIVIIIIFRFMVGDRLFIALGFLALSQLIYLFILDPGNGMARDFPMFLMLVTGLLVWGIYGLIKAKELLRLNGNTIMTLAPLSLLIVLPILFVHLSPPAAEKYLDDYLTYNETKTEAALYAMRDYYVTVGQDQKAVVKEKAVNKAPGTLESQLVTDLYAHARYDESFEYALRLVERYPYVAKYRMQMGNLLKHYKRYADAEGEFKTALELDCFNPEYYHFLSELYREMRLDKKCFEILQDALEIDSRSTMILIDLTGYHFRTRRPDMVDSLTDVLFSINPDEPYAHMYKGLLAEQRGRKEIALGHLERFIEINDRLPEVGVIRKRINTITLELRDTTLAE